MINTYTISHLENDQIKFRKGREFMLLVRVFCGDITKMPGNIIIPVKSNGDWSDDLCSAIRINRPKTPYFVGLSYELEALEDEQKKSLDGKIFPIRDMFFIIDDLALPLSIFVSKLLESSHLANYDSIFIPPLRITSDSGFILTMRAVLDIKEGIFDFKNKYPESNLLINIIVDNNEDLMYLIRGVLYDYC